MALNTGNNTQESALGLLMLSMFATDLDGRMEHIGTKLVRVVSYTEGQSCYSEGPRQAGERG